MARKKKKEEPVVEQKVDAVIEMPEAPEIEAEELPILTAVTMYKLPDQGPNAWVVLKLKIQGDKVLEVESSEPNMRNIAIEQLKMDVVKQFFNPFES